MIAPYCHSVLISVNYTYMRFSWNSSLLNNSRYTLACFFLSKHSNQLLFCDRLTINVKEMYMQIHGGAALNTRYISQKDWYALYSIDQCIYDVSFTELFEEVLARLIDLVHYTHSLTYVLHYEDSSAKGYRYYSNEIPESYLQKYVKTYSALDYINWYVCGSKPMVFRESDIVADQYRLTSRFMKEWMLPIGLYYGAGMIIASSTISYGGLFLYRGKEDVDFDSREIEILNVINNSLCRKFRSLFPEGVEYKLVRDTNFGGLLPAILTRREREIICLIKNGTLRCNLKDQLFISENTLNKHLDNIFKKLRINTFEELLQLIIRFKSPEYQEAVDK